MQDCQNSVKKKDKKNSQEEKEKIYHGTYFRGCKEGLRYILIVYNR